MSGKALAERAEQQITELAIFLSGLSEEDLHLPCDDDRGGTTVGTVAAHVVAGFSQASMFLRVQQAGGLPTSAPTGGGAFGHSHSHSHGHGIGGGGADDAKTMVQVLERDGAKVVKLLSKTTDEQLKVVPPKIGTVSDGVKTLDAVVSDTLDHQAAHLENLRKSVLAGQKS
jgi:uncharacterized spore protein YtfJ